MILDSLGRGKYDGNMKPQNGRHSPPSIILIAVRILLLLFFCGLLAGCAESLPPAKPVQPSAHNWRTLAGIPELGSVDEAVAYVLKEDSVVNYKGLVSGSEEFKVTLPSGCKVSNWFVDCLFRSVFEPFGKKAVPALIDMLDHDYAYARLGAYYALEQITGRYDEQYRFDVPKEQRKAAVHAWKQWWSKNEHNSRLDSPPNRVYEAKDWESQTIR